jgi:transposase
MSKARLVITAIEVEGRTPAEVIAAYGVSRSWLYELLARYRADGADSIRWHLTHHHQTTRSRATIHRILTRAGTVTPEPAKRPKASYLRLWFPRNRGGFLMPLLG